MKKRPLILLVIVLIIGFLLLWFYFLFTSAIHSEAGRSYYLRPGTSKKMAILELNQQGIIQHPWLFSLYIYPQYTAQLKTGEYFFPKGATPAAIWQQLIHGKGLLYHPFTIIPGWTFAELRQTLDQTPGLRHKTTKLTNQQIMENLHAPNLQPEGEFFPDTYYYTRGIADTVILEHAFTLMQDKLQKAWADRAADLPYKDAYEALIAASLIEKEAYLSAERPMIAGVLVNRLRANMLLQFDPTVIYGLGLHYDGAIHKIDLSADTPYNTYLHVGLPPTPIAMPSLASIQAALHPDLHHYYYFVARGDGSHQFSETLEEHNQAIAFIKKTHLSNHVSTLLPVVTNPNSPSTISPTTQCKGVCAKQEINHAR